MSDWALDILKAFGRRNGTRLKDIDDPTIILPQAMSDTTNDPKAAYGLNIDKLWSDESKAATAPLLSNEDIMIPPSMTALWVRDFYEAKIASGELMVRKIGAIRNADGTIDCNECHGVFGVRPETTTCPECGAKIIEG